MSALKILPTPAEIVAHLDKYAHGQSRAKHDLAVAVYNHYISQAYQEKNGEDLGRHHTLVIGPTGSGKTYMIKLLAKFLGVPYAFASATDMTDTGFSGMDFTTVFRVLYDRADGNTSLAEKGIVFIDEIDKSANLPKGSDGSAFNIQKNMLTYLDGMITRKEGIDTGKVLFITSGAFVGLPEIINKRCNKLPSPEMGFHLRYDETPEQISPSYELLAQTQTSDLIEFGLIPEFIGRFTNITVLQKLKADDLKAIVKSMKRSALELHQKMATVHGIELDFTDEALDFIANETAKLDTGARGLSRILGQALDLVEDKFVEYADKGVTKISITAENIKEKSVPELTYGEKSSDREDLELRLDAMSSITKLKEEGYDDLSDLWD